MEPRPEAPESAPLCGASRVRSWEDFPAAAASVLAGALPCPAPPRLPQPGALRRDAPGNRGPDARSPDLTQCSGAGRSRPTLRSTAAGALLAFLQCESEPPPETRVRQVPTAPAEPEGAQKPPAPAPETDPSAALAPVPRTWDRADAQEAPARVQSPRGVAGGPGRRAAPDRAGAASPSCRLSAASGEGLGARPEAGSTGLPAGPAAGESRELQRSQ